ncbi:MAG: flagellar M-ring protein FliF C-terminal domain-containing protein, partial [Pseudomonadota bacterium]
DGAAGDESNSNTTSSRERVNYEVSETELEVLRVPGAVKRLTVAVLVNAVRVDNPASGPSFEPRPEAELEALRELVASAVGFEPERGDVITLKSMELPVPELPGTAAAPSFWQAQNFDMMNMIQVGTLALVSLVLGFLVVRPILMNAAQLPAPAPPALTSPPGLQEPPVLTGEIHDDPVPGLTPQLASDPAPPAGLPARSEDTVHRLRQMIGERQEETVEILRNWLEDSEENA